MFVDWETIDPPLYEEQFKECDEEWIHHANSEDNGVGILHGWLHDGRIADGCGEPLSIWRVTHMASDPRVRKVAASIMFLTLMAPMLYAYVIYGNLSIM